MQRPLTIAATLLIALAVSIAAVIAQDRDRGETEAAEQDLAPEQPDQSETTEDGGEEADADPGPAPEGPRSAEDVLNELLERRGENPLLEPIEPTPPTDGAADARQHPLRREGQFILTRRGRMVPADTPERGGAVGGASPVALGSGIAAWRFVFESDRSNLQDPPMYLMPCRLLEEMEAVVQRRGDSAVFVLSGRVFTYRGANYLLPTLMKLAPQRGNLQP